MMRRGRLIESGVNRADLEWQPSEAYAGAYGPADELNQLSSAGGQSLSWDASGNLTSDGVNTYAWGYGNRLIGASRSGMTAAYAGACPPAGEA